MIALQIDGMSCQHCVRAVTETLEGVPGVIAVAEVALDPGRARVEGTATPDALIAALAAAGYRATRAD